MKNQEREALYIEAQKLWNEDRLKEALEKFTEAAKKGHAEAAYWAGGACFSAIGTEASLEKAAYYYELAAANGMEEASPLAGLSYALKQNDRAALKKAIAEISAVAKDSHPEFYHLLASTFYYGEHVDSNKMLAAYFAIKAVKNGYAAAYLLLGEMYFRGEYLPKNMAFAKYCFNKYQSECGDGVDLSEYLENSDYGIAIAREVHFPRFDDDAPDFFDRPCPYQTYCEGLLYLYGSDRPLDPRKGKRCLEEAMALGEATAYNAYATRIIGSPFEGDYYDFDGYVCFPPSYQRAKKLYLTGAKLYDPDSLFALGLLHASGEGGFGRDYDKAKHYFEGHYYYTNSPETMAILDDFDAYFKAVDAGDYTPIETYAVKKRCSYCDETWMLILTDAEYRQYEKGDPDEIPDCITGLNPFEKEFFLSQLCPLCQARVFNKLSPDLDGRWLKI